MLTWMGTGYETHGQVKQNALTAVQVPCSILCACMVPCMCLSNSVKSWLVGELTSSCFPLLRLPLLASHVSLVTVVNGEPCEAGSA